MILGIALAALLGLSLAQGTARAQTGSQAAEAPAGTPAAGAPAEVPAAGAPAGPPPAGASAGSAADDAFVVDPAEEPGTVMREPERLQHKPSGFWTSGRPAVGGAYRYRLLGIGVAVLVITGIVTVWVVRRHPSRRA